MSSALSPPCVCLACVCACVYLYHRYITCRPRSVLHVCALACVCVRVCMSNIGTEHVDRALSFMCELVDMHPPLTSLALDLVCARVWPALKSERESESESERAREIHVYAVHE